MKLNQILIAFVFLLTFFSCEKTEEYVAVPYTCDCGRITWSGIEHEVTGVGANYLNLDSLGQPNHNSRKYDLTVSVKDETDNTDIEAHHVNSILEFKEINNIYYYIYSDTTEIDTSIINITIEQPKIYIEEINQNTDATALKEYKAIDGTIQVNVSEDGLEDNVSFNLTLKEYDGISTFGSPFPYSGTFTFKWE